MRIHIDVINVPGSMADWKFAEKAPPSDLPELTDEQRSIAQDFGISEEDYARSVLGRRYAEARYRRYAEQFAELLRKAGSAQSLESADVIYDLWDDKFHCRLKANGSDVLVSFSAAILTAPLERGDEAGLHQVQKAVEFGLEQALQPGPQTGGSVAGGVSQ